MAAHQQDMTINKTMRIKEDLKMWEDTVEQNWQETLGRMNPNQLKEWNLVYDSIKEDFQKKDINGDELVKWKYQRYMNDYLACIQSVDESVGAILDYLKTSGLDKNTIVVYTSDQGFYLGEHGWFDKRFMYDESYRTPLLVSWPGVTQPGAVNTDLVSNLDFAETFLDAAGVAIPTDMQGLSLKPVLEGRTPATWRKEHYYHYYEFPGYHSVKRHYGISDSRYKLIHFYYDIDEWEMYDLQSDPKEMKNVYNLPQYEEVKIMLHHKLDSIRLVYHDNDELTKRFLPSSGK
jgi:arylsulfatase A-like enzyme